MLLYAPIAIVLLAAPVPEDMEALQGTWSVVEYVKEGKKLPEGDPVYQSKVVFKGDKTFDPRHEGDSKRVATYKLDPSKSPKEIDVTYPGGTIKGIYQLDGDELKMHMAHLPSGADRPKDFHCLEDGSRSRLLVLRRDKPRD